MTDNGHVHGPNNTKGGGIKLFFNHFVVNYYTGRYNGCYKEMWFLFGDWCGDATEFGYTNGTDCVFWEGKALDNGWLPDDLYPPNYPRMTPEPTPPPHVPTPAMPVPTRIGPAERPKYKD
jgi:hypothetical protein